MNEVINLLRQLGLSDEESKIYLFTLTNSLTTVLQVAKNTGINRTSAYRYCESLAKKGFLLKNALRHTTKYEAVSVDFLSTKVKKIEDKAKNIQANFQKLAPTLQNLVKNQDNQIKVIQYTGKEEVKQLVWNSLKTKTEVCSFGYRTLSEPLGKLFIVRWWNQSVRQKIVTKIIANPGTYEMKDNVDQTTKEKYPKIPSGIWQARVIDPKILPITQESFIYNNIYAIVQWDKKQVFGVEIYNQQVADQQKAVFEVLWKLAKKA